MLYCLCPLRQVEPEMCASLKHLLNHPGADSLGLTFTATQNFFGEHKDVELKQGRGRIGKERHRGGGGGARRTEGREGGEGGGGAQRRAFRVGGGGQGGAQRVWGGVGGQGTEEGRPGRGGGGAWPGVFEVCSITQHANVHS